MGHESSSVDQLYLNAETLAQDFSLFPRRQSASVIGGLLNNKQIEARVKQLRGMEVDAYIAATVAPTEESTRPGAKDVVAALDVPVANVIERGPFYCAELSFDFNGTSRKVGLIAQNRAHGSGVWGPEHHELASKWRVILRLARCLLSPLWIRRERTLTN